MSDQPMCPTCQQPVPKTPVEVRLWNRKRTADYRAKKRAEKAAKEQPETK